MVDMVDIVDADGMNDTVKSAQLIVDIIEDAERELLASSIELIKTRYKLEEMGARIMVDMVEWMA
jgi:hypothetical protein